MSPIFVSQEGEMVNAKTLTKDPSPEVADYGPLNIHELARAAQIEAEKQSTKRSSNDSQN